MDPVVSFTCTLQAGRTIQVSRYSICAYTRICLCIGVIFLLGSCSESRVIQTSIFKGCIAHLSTGVVNLRPVARTDGRPRFTTVYMGLNFSFNPCIQFRASDINHSMKSLFDVNLSSPENSSSSSLHIVLGTQRSASFKHPTKAYCHSKHTDTVLNKCPISSILSRTQSNNIELTTKLGSEAMSGLNVLTRTDTLNKGVHWEPSISADTTHDGDDIELKLASRVQQSLDQPVVGENMIAYPTNITAILRLGSKGVCHNYKMLVALQCNPDLVSPSEALFRVIHTACPDKLYFLLSHRCCCQGLCHSKSAVEDDVMHAHHMVTSRVTSYAGYVINNTAANHVPLSHPDIEIIKLQAMENGTFLEVASRSEAEPMPKFMWLLLVVNVGVLSGAMLIAAVCCRAGGSSVMVSAQGTYNNFLPDLKSIRQQALHSGNSRLTLASSTESFKHVYHAPPKSAEYLDYSSSRTKSAQLPQLANCLIDAGELDIGQRLGGGLFGDTYIAKWKDRTVAAKRITVGIHQDQLTEQHYSWLVEQVSYLSKQRFKHLSAVIGVCRNVRQLYVLTEYIEGETLKELLNKPPELLNWQRKVKICLQIAEGLAYLHSAKTPVLHRDMRCTNIIIDNYERVKIVDFGMTKLVQKLRQVCNGRKGCYCNKETSALPASLRWTAPEVLEHPQAEENGDIITPACDVYSYAMVMWEIASHCDPYEDISDENEVLELIVAGVRPRVDTLTGMIPHLRELMVICWDDTPENRPSIKQVLHQLKNCAQIVYKMAPKPRSRVNSSTHYLKSALNISAD